MKTFLTISIVLLLIVQNANSQISEYSNFRLMENGEIIWRHVYERPNSPIDSLKKIIFNNVKSNSALKIIEENNEELIVDMFEMIFEKNGDLFNGRLIFDAKEGKYRVTYSGSRRFFGIKTKRNASIFGVSAQVNSDNVGIRFEDVYLKKDGSSLTGVKGLDVYNELFLKKFDYQMVQLPKKDDW